MAPWYGLMSRWYFALVTPGASRRAHAMNLGFAALDVAEWVALRRGRRSGLAWRLPLHVADEVVYTAVTSGDLIAASSVRGPLALESTIRWGPAGLLTPAVGSLGVWLLGRRPLSVDSAGWPFVLGAAGLQARLIRRRHLARAEAEHAEQLDAETAEARLMGQHSIAMGADSVVDALEALAPLLGRPATGSALHTLLDAWKASLSAQVEGRATYLGTELLRWERLRNLDPDLAARVQLVVAEGDGTALIDRNQTDALSAALDALGLRGRVAVRVVGDPTARMTSTEPLTLTVGDHLVQLPAGSMPAPTIYDPTPVAFLVAAATLGFEAFSTRAGVSAPWLAPPVLAYVAAARWSHQQLKDADGPATRTRIVAVAEVIGGLGAVVTVLAQRNQFTKQGLSDLGSIAVLEGPLLVAAWSFNRLSPRARAVAAASFAAIIAVAFACSARPRSVRSLAAELGLLAAAFAVWRAVPGLLDEEARARTASSAAGDREVVAEAHERGRQLVIELVSAARDEARLAAAAATGADDGLQQEIERRLVDIDRRIEELRCAES